MCVFLFIGRIANLGNNPLFVYLGVLPWSFFATAITNAGNSVVGSERIVTKVYFPRLAIPMASVGAAVVDFAIAFCLLVPMMIYYGVAPGLGTILLVPLIFAIIWLLAMGIGTALAGLNVLYRDFRYVIPFMVQIWMLATPSIYAAPTAATAAGAHPSIKLLLWLNPMTGLISAFRAAVMGGELHAGQLITCGAVALGACLAGCSYFRRLESRFADLI
jgi:lipopolysaccharide transport system permease protein